MLKRKLLSGSLVALIALTAIAAAGSGNRENTQTTVRTDTNSGRTPIPGTIIIKYDQQTVGAKSALAGRVQRVLAKYDAGQPALAYPHMASSGKPGSERFSQLYHISLPEQHDVVKTAAALSAIPGIAYAEPKYEYTISVVPNDTLYGNQSHLGRIAAPPAWDVVKGEQGDVVIAIVDGGTAWQHQDLLANIWSNPGEIAGNGVDDDNNGFIDDVRGWNFPSGNNNPVGVSGQPQNAQHGTHTAGIAAAVANNTTGIAGVSWNAKFMPINAASRGRDLAIQFGYDGIMYAAANGADVISCSWGGMGNPSRFEQEIIDFAWENGAVVVAASGNESTNNDDKPSYPAQYNHVISVGNTDNSDAKAFSSNYGVSVDVFAPGTGILSTVEDNRYNTLSGTSMSTPLVAGVVALLQTQHPDWSIDQIIEQLRATSDPISQNNPGFTDLLGKGRINALNAVTQTNVISVRIVDVEFDDQDGDGVAEQGEAIDLRVKFANYLSDVENLNLSLTASSRAVLSVSNTTISSIASGDTAVANFSFTVAQGAEDGEVLKFICRLVGDNYQDLDLFRITVNPPTFRDQNTGRLTTSITSDGNIGFVDQSGSPGTGFVFNDFNYLFEGGLLLGVSPAQISDCVRDLDDQQEVDFKQAAGTNISIANPGELAEEEGLVIFTDSLALEPMYLRVEQESFAYTGFPNDQFVIFKYTITNLSSQTYDSLFAGIYVDWDITPAADFGRFDSRRNMGYVANAASSETRLAATRLLSTEHGMSYRSIDNAVDLYPTMGDRWFTAAKKWQYMSGGIQTGTLNATDVSTLMSAGPIQLAPGAEKVVAFALIAAENINTLATVSDAAQMLWDNDLVRETEVVAPTAGTSLFQNAALPRYAEVVVVSDQLLLQEPEVTLANGGASQTVGMSAIPGASTSFKGSVQFEQDGTYQIDTRVISVNGLAANSRRNFSVTTANAGQTATIVSADGRAALELTPGSLAKSTLFIGEEFVDEFGENWYRFNAPVSFREPVTARLKFDPSSVSDPGKLFIYQNVAGAWEPLPSQVDLASEVVKAKILSPGEIKIMENPDYNHSNIVPGTFALLQNYPNPFNPETRILFTLPERAFVTLRIFNMVGQEVFTLVQSEREAGEHIIRWNGENKRGQTAPSGVYFYQMTAGDFSATRKMILLR